MSGPATPVRALSPRGGDDVAMAGAAAHANANAHAAVRLRTLCASAAASIKDECDGVLQKALVAEGSIRQEDKDSAAGEGRLGEVGGHAAADDRDQSTTAATNGSEARLSLADCGEPLVHLLSRQASRLVALYEADMPSSPSLMLPVAVGPAKAAEHDSQSSAVPSPVHGARQLHGGHASHGSAAGDDLILKRLDDIISIAYSKFYAYLYKDLPLCWRQLYTDASILKFSYLFLSSSQQSQGLERSGVDATRSSQDARDAAERLEFMVKTLDLALILAGAGGFSRGRKWIDTAFDLFQNVWDFTNADDTVTSAIRGSRHGWQTMTTAAAATATATATATLPAAKRARLDPSAHKEAAPRPALRSFSTFEPFTPPVRNAIRRVSADVMDMAAFQRYLDCADPHRGPEPLILTGLIEHWPARSTRPWNNPKYLLSRTFGGRRLVPVEIGRSYVDEGWGQKLVTFGEFLRNHIDPTTPVAAEEDAPAPAGQYQERRRTPAAEQQAGDRSDAAAAGPPGRRPAAPAAAPAAVAYLAQHQLFLQLPQLRNDILIPDHCYTAPPPHPTDPSQDQPELDTPLLNAWLGPPGTITPLHTDPYHNLLAQVVGRKYVRLYSPLESGRMRARGKEGGVEMHNTSAWDVGALEGWDEAAAGGSGGGAGGGGGGGGEGSDAGGRDAGREQFGEVPFVDCILEPGDTLYVPIGWWHYVRGLSVSFSVSLWWNG
ncbi:domain-containing protein 5 [Diaporthe amygdali]|uniref:domain-containing protein 5 n=1 Tax=Phomopsis amygdali TaxID=1214568 RepID=UPI0022FF44C2|nr:domain-containing protein 5 [Diaporthe amygdali]KAJ0115290.1 domain-containing protein 5 [Diaporthe amygdali]